SPDVPVSVTSESTFDEEHTFSMVSTARELAISPCASPPMPSDRMNRFSGSTIRKESSLFERTRPRSVTPPLSICTSTPSKLFVGTRDTPAVDTPAFYSTLAEAYRPPNALRPSDYLALTTPSQSP